MMRYQVQNRLNRFAFVGYHSAVTIGWPRALGLLLAGHVQQGRADMDVSGLGSVQGAGPVRSATPANAARPVETPASAITSPKDELEISSAAQALDRAHETPEARAERIAQIKDAIDAGSYDTDEKLEAALERMFGSLDIDLDDE